MTPLDHLRAFGQVPSGTDLEEVFDWASGQDSFRDGALDRGDLERALGAMTWHRLVELRSAWPDGPASLSARTASLAAGLAQLGGVVGISATWDHQGLDLRLGTPSADGSGLLGTVSANLPGTVLSHDLGRRVVPWSAAGALQAVLDPEADPAAPGLLDRLTALQGVDWQVQALLVPVYPAAVRTHCRDLAELALVLAGARSRQVQLTPQTTATADDPRVVRLAAAVDADQSRAEVALRTGAFSTVVSLAAGDGAQLAAAVGAATGSVPSASTGWRFHLATDGVLPAAAVAARDAIDLLRPPAHDVLGLPARRWERLDEHPEAPASGGPAVVLGTTERGAPLALPIAALTHHVLVTGGSGAGKSSFLASLLGDLAQSGIPFWVVEPVKDEYRSLAVPGIRHWRIGAADPGLPWGLNPLEVPEGVPVALHLDLLVSLVRTSFGLPDPLPHLLELGLQRVYEARGWDLGADRQLSAPVPRDQVDWPTLSELLEVCLTLPAELRYDTQIQGNLRAALLARLGNLTRGPRGRLLDTTAPFPIDDALRGPVVVNLDGIGDDHARSFVMGLLLVRLVEARRSDPSATLRHVTVVEEAHRLLGRDVEAAVVGSADPVAGTAARFANLLGEIRSTGEGVVVVDQSPHALVRGALVNTSTKVALRATDRDDQQALGAAMGLRPEQEHVLATLRRHEALVSWEGMDAPVRADLHAVALRSLPPVAGEVPVAVRLRSGPSAVKQAAAVFVRVDERRHMTARTALLQAIDVAHPGITASAKADLLADAVDAEVAFLARSRGWSRSARTAATRAALGGRYGSEHPRTLLLDGRRPHLACASACPTGGCLVGELATPEARATRDEGPGTLVRLAGHPEEARRRLTRRALAVVPAGASEELGALVRACITVQVFDDWADPDTVGGLVQRLAPAGVGRGPA